MYRLAKINLLCCLIFSVLLISCSSSSNSNDSGEFITAAVETLNFESSNTPNGATASKLESEEGIITLLIQGVDKAGNGMTLTISDYKGPNTYDIGFEQENLGTSSGGFVNMEGFWSSANDGGSGTITVLIEHEDEVSGRFEFISVGGQADNVTTKTITNGSFRVSY